TAQGPEAVRLKHRINDARHEIASRLLNLRWHIDLQKTARLKAAVHEQADTATRDVFNDPRPAHFRAAYRLPAKRFQMGRVSAPSATLAATVAGWGGRRIKTA